MRRSWRAMGRAHETEGRDQVMSREDQAREEARQRYFDSYDMDSLRARGGDWDDVFSWPERMIGRIWDCICRALKRITGGRDSAIILHILVILDRIGLTK